MGRRIVNWKGKRVLVTGAGGFIGSHLVERLVALGADTRALVHYRSDGSLGWLDNSSTKNSTGSFEVIAGDIRDRNSVDTAMQDREIVFHLAALIGIPYSYHAPMSYIQTNIEGTANLLIAARDGAPEMVVHTSTSEVYGSARYVPMDEGHPLQGQSPYSASKIGADKMAEAFHASFGVPVATARPFNTYGPRQSARAVIPTIIMQALAEPQIILGNLDPVRDFNYVLDTVDGFIRIAEHPEAAGQVFNLGPEKPISIRDLTKKILALIGRGNLPIVSQDERVRPDESEVDKLHADSSKARAQLDWTPGHTLEEGLVETIEWIRANLDIYRAGAYAV
jgi:NAD dependent epimerase/dehydratase